MKIAIVSPHLPLKGRSIGGAESYSLNLAISLAKIGNEVAVFAGASKTKEFRFGDNLKIRYLKTRTIPFDPTNPLSFSLIRDLISEQCDIIHVHQLFTFFNILSCCAGKIKGTTSVLTDHGGGWRLAAIPRLCSKFPNAFIAVSKFSLRWLLYFAPNKKSFVAYGGVDTDYFHPHYRVDEAKQELGLDQFSIILYVGRILSHKGIDVLIRALKHLPSNVKLLVVGSVYDYNYFGYIKELASKICPGKVVFMGFVEKSRLPVFYNICDIFVLPSVYYDYLGRYRRFPELLGLTKLEAMACGKPVIVSNVGGLPEQVFHGKNGYVVDVGDEMGLANAINTLLMDEKLRKRMGQEGLAMVRRRLTWNAVAKRVLQYYQSILTSTN